MDAQRKSHSRFRKAAGRVESKAAPLGWRTTDADEIALRRARAAHEQLRVENIDRDEPVFSSFHAHSTSGANYLVEIRSLSELDNSCSCPDFYSNGLGTCKHIEAVTRRLRRAPAAARGDGRSPRAEVFLRRTGEPGVGLTLPRGLHRQAQEVVQRYFGDDGQLRGDPAEAIPALHRELDTAPVAVTRALRLSRELLAWVAERGCQSAREAERAAFVDDLRRGTRTLPTLKNDVYPYQIDGVLHLAFTNGRCSPMKWAWARHPGHCCMCVASRARAMPRAVVCPASLKTEWEEQIQRFTELPYPTVIRIEAARLAGTLSLHFSRSSTTNRC